MRFLLDADWVIDALVGRRNAAGMVLEFSTEGIAIRRVTVGGIDEGAFGNPDPQAHLLTLREILQPLHLPRLTCHCTAARWTYSA